MTDTAPIVEVTEKNLLQRWSCLHHAVKNATFVAIDCELSGLGNRKKINSQDLTERYTSMSQVAQDYCVLSLGVSCFCCLSVDCLTAQDKDGDDTERKQACTHSYTVHTFNILTLCTDPYMVEHNALKFLQEHNFDFNKLYSEGAQYYKGCDRPVTPHNDEGVTVRHLFSTIVRHKKPLVIHNGLVDLVFLYQSFYADLPKGLDTFAADLHDLFPSGVYDTKYLAEYHHNLPASYLEFLFKKMQLRNAHRQRKGQTHVKLVFPSYSSDAKDVEWHPYLDVLSYRPEEDADKRELCQWFAYHGFCNRGKCVCSHSVNRAVREIQTATKSHGRHTDGRTDSTAHLIEDLRSRRREEEEQVEAAEQAGGGKTTRTEAKGPHGDEPERATEKRRLADDDGPAKKTRPSQEEANGREDEDEGGGGGLGHGAEKSQGHRAGYDAFMTGCVFAGMVSETEKWRSPQDAFTPGNIGMAEKVNKVHLMGKKIPFLVRTGAFAKRSAKHCAKVLKVRKALRDL